MWTTDSLLWLTFLLIALKDLISSISYFVRYGFVNVKKNILTLATH